MCLPAYSYNCVQLSKARGAGCGGGELERETAGDGRATATTGCGSEVTKKHCLSRPRIWAQQPQRGRALPSLGPGHESPECHLHSLHLSTFALGRVCGEMLLTSRVSPSRCCCWSSSAACGCQLQASWSPLPPLSLTQVFTG